MTSDRLLDRVRAANPAPAAGITNDELFARIVASPGDARLAPRRRRLSPRGVALIAAAILLTAGGGAFGAVQLVLSPHASPRALFQADPAGRFSRRPPHPGGTGQTVIPRTVHRVATFTVPGVGRFQYWIAISRPSGWLCNAIRQPDGTWADLENPGDKYEVGGPVPGCGTSPWHDAHGFSYVTSIMQSRETQWRIVYGYAPTSGHPVTVRDTVHRVTAPIGDGRYFAIVMRLCKGRAQCRLPVPRPGWGLQLQTLDASGRALVTDAYDPGA